MDEERAKRWLTEAEGYLELGLFERALERLEAVERTAHCRADRALLRGSLHREREEYSAAVPHFRAALELRPGDIPATVGVGWCLKRSGKLNEAAQAYQAALQRHPQEGLLHYNLACYQCLLGRTAEALEGLQRAIQIDPEFRDLAQEEDDFALLKGHPEFLKALRVQAEDRENQASDW